MKALVVYHSLYGNTRTVAEAIGEEIAGEVEVVHVDDAPATGLNAYDLVVVGAPTHSGRPSPDMNKYLDQIQPRALEGVRVAAFDTRMTNRLILLFGTAGPKIAKALESNGGTRAGPPQGFFVTGGEGPLKEGELERAAAWARSLA